MFIYSDLDTMYYISLRDLLLYFFTVEFFHLLTSTTAKIFLKITQFARDELLIPKKICISPDLFKHVGLGEKTSGCLKKFFVPLRICNSIYVLFFANF